MSPKTTGAVQNNSVKEGPIDTVFLALAAMYEQMGQSDTALSIYNSILKRNQNCVTALCSRGMIQLMKQQDEKAQKDIQKAVAFGPKDRTALRTRGVANMINGNFDAALKDFKKALESNEWDSLTCVFTYMMLGKSGESVEALALLNDAIASKLKATDWPYPIIQFFRGDITMTDLMAIASVSKGKMLETRAYLGFSKVFSQNAQEAKPDLQFVYNARAGSPLIRTLALRGLQMIQAEQSENIAAKHERAERNSSMDWMD